MGDAGTRTRGAERHEVLVLYISDVKEKDDSLHNRQLKRGKSDTNLERLEDLISDGVCVAGDLELTQDTTPESMCPDTSLSSGILR